MRVKIGYRQCRDLQVVYCNSQGSKGQTITKNTICLILNNLQLDSVTKKAPLRPMRPPQQSHKHLNPIFNHSLEFTEIRQSKIMFDGPALDNLHVSRRYNALKAIMAILIKAWQNCLVYRSDYLFVKRKTHCSPVMFSSTSEISP